MDSDPITSAKTEQPQQALPERPTAIRFWSPSPHRQRVHTQQAFYDFIGVVSKAAEKFIVFDGVLEVLTNPASASAYDPRSHARKVLDLIEAAMEGRIPNGMESYTIGGRSINKIPLKELRELYDRYKQDVEREIQAERLANGRRSGKNIGVRFGRPSGHNVQGYSYTDLGLHQSRNATSPVRLSTGLQTIG